MLADDLMWSTRIVEAVRRAGGTPVALANADELAVAIEATELDESTPTVGAIVDLGGRRYDGAAAISAISTVRLPVIAVAQHDDQVTRKRGLDAGAARVFSYDKFFRDGTRLVAAWFGDDDAPVPPTAGGVEGARGATPNEPTTPDAA